MVYPEKITDRLTKIERIHVSDGANAIGTGAALCCGSYVRFSLVINAENRIADAGFNSNGCGFMLAAADVLAESLIERRLVDLHGLHSIELSKSVEVCLGDIPVKRNECIGACVDALRSAFMDFRARRIDEFVGEKALICTCFGVSEDTIECAIDEHSLETVADVTVKTNAGGGCGSCRMLIQEIIDGRRI